jgi:broad specificity phosphatase PhoE
MKKILILCFVFSMFACVKAQNETTNKTTTYYFVRHAEKDSIPINDPKLLSSGQGRAKKYAAFFKNKKLKAVYTTDFTRTKNTAQPTAIAQGLKPVLYHPTDIDYNAFLKETKGKTVLVVGHSNTIPGFVNNIIGENEYEEIDESIYNHMYIVTIKNGEIKHELKRVD